MSEPTMFYRPDNQGQGTLSEQPYRPGGDLYYYKVFCSSETKSCLKNGWFRSPSDFNEGSKPKVDD